MWKPKPVPGWGAIALSLTSAAVSAGVTYVISKRLLEKQYQEELTAEIEKTRIHYQQMYSTPVLVADDADETTEEDLKLFKKVMEASQENDPEPGDLVGKALDALQEYRSDAPDTEPGDDRTPPPPVTVNIFTDATPPGEEVLEALMAERNPDDGPYIITKEEFYANEPDFEQLKFTYWEGEDILVDDRHEFNPIDNIDLVAGEDNLLRFGYGSADIHVVYIRNESTKMDLHVTRSTGIYADEVMGPDTTEHLAHSQPRKFRIRDE